MPERRPILIEAKSSPPVAGMPPRWSWWVTVDRHPYSDKRSYFSEEAARVSAEEWCRKNYPDREITHIEGTADV